MEPLANIRLGDILLTRGEGMSCMANLLGQTVVAGRKADFSHASLCVAPDVILDSRPFQHVRLRSIFQEMRNGQLASGKPFLVLRKPALTASYEAMDETSRKLIRPLYSQLDKKYNWLIGVTQSSDADPLLRDAERVFCSELCVQMLTAVDAFPERHLRPSRTLPVDLEHLLHCGWQNATDAWAADLASIEDDIRDPASDRGKLVLEREQRVELSIAETLVLKHLSDSLDPLSGIIASVRDEMNATFSRLAEAMNAIRAGKQGT